MPPLIHVRLATIAVVALALTLAAQTQPQVQPKTAPNAKPAAPRSEDSQLYRNTTFGFRYQIPYGWVDRTQEMGSPDAGSEQGKGEVLLAIFERPPQAAGDTVNCAVVIASESAASYPGLRTAADYIGPLTELTASKGFKAEGDATAFEIDSRQLVRADFVKPLNEKLNMYQSTLVLLRKQQIVSFTFVAGSEAEVDDLVDALHFSAAKPSAH